MMNHVPDILRCARGASRLVGCAALLTGWSITLPHVRADESVENADAQRAGIEYRRVFVPTDEPATWPLEGERYLPIESREFEELLSAGNNRGKRERHGAILTAASYAGRMQADGSIAGRGRWEIELRGPGPTVLRLGDPSLIVRNAQWRDSPPSLLRMGRWASNGKAALDLGIEVSRSGVVEFDWQAPAASRSHDADPTWRLPQALASRLSISLSPDHRPVVAGGVVLRSATISSEAEAESPWLRWEIAVGPAAGSLQIVSTTAASTEETPDVACREEVVYSVHERGLDIHSTFLFDDTGPSLRELVIPLPPGLQVMSAKADGAELEWRVAAHERQATAVFLSLPQTAGHGPRAVTLHTWQSLILDHPWKLPRVRPDNVFWTSGELEFSIAPLLALQQLTPTDCVQTGVSRRPDSQSGAETSWFTLYSPAAGLEVTITRREVQAVVQQMSSISVAESVVSGRFASQLKVSDGVVHGVTGEVSAGWVVASIESIPANALGDWFLSRVDDRNRLTVQLAQPATPERPVLLVVNAQSQQSDVAQPLPTELFRMVRWQGLPLAGHFASVQVPEPNSAEPAGGLREVLPAEIPAEIQPLLESVGIPDRIFDLAHAPRTASFHVTGKRGAFDVDTRIDAVLEEDSIRQAYALRARFRSRRPDDLLIFADAPLGEAVRWADGLTGLPLDAERVAPGDPRLAGSPSHGELWHVRLPSTAGNAVDIRASVVAPLAPHRQLALLAALDATQQAGQVVFYGGQLPGPEFELEHMQPIPPPLTAPPADAAHVMSPPSAAYRYDPIECLQAAGGPRVWIRPARMSRPIPLAARRAALTTYLLPDGLTLQRAEFQLENVRGRQFELRPPADAQSISIAVNDHAIGMASDRPPAEPIVVPLPSDGETARLSIEFAARNSPLKVGSIVRPPLFNDIRVVTGEWTIWLPHEYALMGDDMAPLGTEFSPLRRLLGPLVPDQQSSSAAWIEIVEGSGAEADADRLAHAGDSEASTTEEPFKWMPGKGERPASGSAHAPQLHGWRAYRTQLVSNGAPTLTIVQPAATGAWGIAAFLLCVAVGQPLARYLHARYVWVIALAAFAAVALPATYSPIATGALLGLTISLVVAWPPRQSVEESPTRTWAGHAATTTMALLAAGFCASRAQGQPTDGLAPTAAAAGATATDPALRTANAPSPRGGIQRVLIPTDTQGSTTGTKWYVSESLLRELYRLTQADAMADRTWLLLDARCDGELIESKTLSGVASGDWKLTLAVEVLARDTTIALPLVRREANWAPSAALDGLPTAIAWQNDGRGCEIAIAEPGRYDLEITFAPHVASVRDQEQIVLTVPPLLGGKFNLRFPAAWAPEEMSGVLPIAGEGLTGTLNRYFDGSGRLTIGWRQVQTAQGDSPGVRVSELQWLQIAENDVRLTAKYVVEGSAQRPESLSVAYDAPWELDPPGELTAEQLSSDGRRRTLRLAVPPDDADRQEFVVRWRLPNTTPLGQIKLPAIGLSTPTAALRWFGVSHSPTLQCELLAGHTAATATSVEFLTRWDDDPLADELALVAARLDPLQSLAIAVQPRTPPPAVSESLQVVAARDGLRVRYQADVATYGVGHYRFPLEIAEHLEVDRVTVAQNGQDVPLRWTRANGTALGTFFGQRLASDFRLTLEAHVPHHATSTYALPRVAAPGADQQSVQFYRTEDALLETVGLETAVNVESPASEPPTPAEDVYLVATHSLPTDAASAPRLVVTPNVVQTAGPTATFLEREADAWWAVFACQLTVDQGELAALRLRAPQHWIGPLEAQSNVPARVQLEAAAGSTSTVVVRMSKPVTRGQKLELRVRGRLSTDAANPVAVPHIVPATPINGPQFIVVPATVEARPVVWTESGVHASALPAELVRPGDQAAAWKCWQIDSADFRVALVPSPPDRSIPRVRLADTWAALDLDGREVVVTTMVIVSPDAAELELYIPSGQELVGITANGSPMLARQLDDRRWQLAALTANLPQWLEVITCSDGRPRLPSTRVEVARPRLWRGDDPVPVELSLWSVCLPTVATRGDDGVAGRVSAVEQAGLRIDRLAGISEAATPAALDLPEPVGRDWYVPWAACVQHAQRQSLAIIGATRGASASLHVDSAPDAQLDRTLERLAAWLEQADEDFAAAGEPLSRTPAESAGVDLVDRFGRRADDWLFRVADGDVPQLAVDLSASVLPPRQKQMVSLLLVVGVALSVFLLARRPTSRDALYCWPHAALFLIGLAWWLWLWPGWIGLVLAGGSVWLKFWSGWPGHLVRSEGSTVVRASGSV